MQAAPRFFALHALKAGLCVLFISVLLMGFSVPPATAQSAQNPERVADAATVHELARRIGSPNTEERRQALGRITDLAHFAPEVDLTPAVPALVEIYGNDPDEAYRLAAVVTLYLIGDERAMQGVRRRFVQEPSLIVQYASVCALIDLYGSDAFGRDREAIALARSVLTRKREAGRLAGRRYLQMWPRVTVGPLEVVPSDSLQ